MGYTHYWRMQDKISKSNWKKIKEDFERLVEVNEWKNIFSNAGLKNCEFWETQGNDNSPGTLVVSGRLPRIN